MDVGQAMIIITKTQQETQFVSTRIRTFSSCPDYVLVPFEVDSISISKMGNKLVVRSYQNKNDGLLLLGSETKCETVEECQEYARTIAKFAGLPESVISIDIRE
jgi:hypothetical protein